MFWEPREESVMNLRISRNPMVKVQIKSNPASCTLFLVTEY